MSFYFELNIKLINLNYVVEYKIMYVNRCLSVVNQYLPLHQYSKEVFYFYFE